MSLPSKLWRSAALFLRISEAKPRSACNSPELSYFVVTDIKHESWYRSW